MKSTQIIFNINLSPVKLALFVDLRIVFYEILVLSFMKY